jgi:chorismate-pyruvate lyase
MNFNSEAASPILENHCTGGFDPFSGLLYSSEFRPSYLWSIDLSVLTPFQRTLLTLDGTVTKFIESYTLEPVEILRLRQQTQNLPKEHTQLMAARDTEVICRQVILRGQHSTTVYAYAVSLLISDRLPSNLLHDLEIEPKGLGRVLLNNQIESRREILWYGREVIKDLPEKIRCLTGNDFFSRTYCIVTNGKPLMLINEKFPVNL